MKRNSRVLLASACLITCSATLLTIALLKRQCRQRFEQIDRHIEALDAEIATLVAADATLARRHQILTSIAGVGTLTANQLIATMPELGSCLVPAFDGVIFSHQWKDALWDRFCTGAPARQRQSVEQYNIVKRA